MAYYQNIERNSPLAGVEFSPVSDGNLSFFYVDSPTKTEGVKKWLASPEVGQEVIAETRVGGHPVLVTHGDKTRDDLMELMNARGDRLTHKKRERNFEEIAWPIRGTLGMGGQFLQLTSSFMRSGRLDGGLFVFAISNITANLMAFLLGAQQRDDQHRLNFLKEEFNEQLDHHLPSGDKLPNIHEKRAKLRKEPEEDVSVVDSVKGFLKRNSVYAGELGLRFFGAFALVIPTTKWAKGWQALKSNGLKAAYEASKETSDWRRWAGFGSLAGKTIAFTSKSEDPFDPKPHSWLDTFREKVTFRLGGWIEAVSFALLGADGFKNNKISFLGKERRDYLSGTGGMMFATAYVIRHWAKFGVKNVDMDELYAHVTDSLAMMPPDKLPQLMADNAAAIKEHFKDKQLEFGKVFNRLMTDLYRFHHIALDNLGTEPQERIAKINGNDHAKPAAASVVEAKHHAALAQPKTHIEHARTSPSESAHSMSA